MSELDNVSTTDYSKLVTGFTKLFSSIVFSTVWREEMHVKVVWVTMLALANQHGEVLASLPGLADAARVSLDQCKDALARLSAPDEYSRTKDYEGRRIEEVDGGWRLLNYTKYRELRQADERRIQTREAVRKHRAAKKEDVSLVSTVSNVSHGKPKQKQKQITNNWLSPFVEAWRKAYGGEPAMKVLATYIGPLRTEHGADETLRRWKAYLLETPAQFAKPAKFSQTFGSWGGKRATEDLPLLNLGKE